jgi:hypothetical protein
MLRIAACVLATVFVLASPPRARAFEFVEGDLVGIWVKDGFELILFLEETDMLPGSLAGGKSFAIPDVFEDSDEDGNPDLLGARFTALAVRDPDRMFTNPAGVPQANLIYTTAGNVQESLANAGPGGWVAIGQAQSQLDPPGGAKGFLDSLNGILDTDPAVVEDTPQRLVAASTLPQSYDATLGKGTDSVANTLNPLGNAGVTAIVVADASYSVPLYELVQNNDGTVAFTKLGDLSGTAGQSGVGTLRLPEPAGAARAAAALAALGLVARLRRRSQGRRTA